MSDASRLAILIMVGAAALTTVVYVAVRPAPPERMKGYRGPIGALGRWALGPRSCRTATAPIRRARSLLVRPGSSRALAPESGLGRDSTGVRCMVISSTAIGAARRHRPCGSFSIEPRSVRDRLFAGLAATLPIARSFRAVARWPSMMVSYARREARPGVARPNFGRAAAPRGSAYVPAPSAVPPAPRCSWRRRQVIAVEPRDGAPLHGVIHQRLRRTSRKRVPSWR
jgi:hypothetical protein